MCKQEKPPNGRLFLSGGGIPDRGGALLPVETPKKFQEALQFVWYDAILYSSLSILSITIGGSAVNRSVSASMRTKKRRRMTLLLAVLAAIFLVSFSLGRYGVPFYRVPLILIDELLNKISGGAWRLPVSWTPEMRTVVLKIRLPRICLACLVGAALSSAGAAYQGVFQNPMASPDILGASSGAAFGAALAILLGASSAVITLSAFVFGLLTVGLVFLLAQRARGLRVVNLVLAGMMLSSLFSAGTSYIKLVADPSNQLPAITYWLMGSLSGAKNSEPLRAFVPIFLGCGTLFLIRWRINVLALGDEEAHALGVNADALRLIVIVAATLVTAASISVSGMIGWIGLVVPHLMRKLFGGNYRELLPASMLGGAVFLLLTDNISRNLLETGIPIGILTALVGAPFFLYLMMRKEKTL